jgi:CheY-like chemotaxis protein
MDGLELRKEINENEFLRKKSIPFIFLTTTSTKSVIEEAYEMMVQGYFVKPNSIQEIKETIKMIIDYWKVCRHPNTEI